MIRDEELQAAIATSVSPDELHDFDPAEIACLAAMRTRRRRTIVAALALLTVATTASTVYATRSPNSVTTADPSAPATSPHGGARPACLAPSAQLIGGGTSGSERVIASARVGTQTTAAAALRPMPATRIVHAELVVAAPGSRSGAGAPASMPANAAIRAENQLDRSSPVLDAVPDGQRLTITFQATEPGKYPVFFIAQRVHSATCLPPAPPAGTPATGMTVQELGTIVVT